MPKLYVIVRSPATKDARQERVLCYINGELYSSSRLSAEKARQEVTKSHGDRYHYKLVEVI